MNDAFGMGGRPGTRYLDSQPHPAAPTDMRGSALWPSRKRMPPGPIPPDVAELLARAEGE
jgi:hypothetical protein